MVAAATLAGCGGTDDKVAQSTSSLPAAVAQAKAKNTAVSPALILADRDHCERSLFQDAGVVWQRSATQIHGQSDIDMKSILGPLEMGIAFDCSSADFSALASEGVCVTGVTHHALDPSQSTQH